MHIQENILKKTSILINEKKFEKAKLVLLNFLKDGKNIKISQRIYYQLYLVFNGLREFKNAKNYLEKCLKINENNHIVLNNLANIFLKEKNLIKAEKFYLKSIDKKKDYSIAIINLAILYEQVGRLEESKKCYLKAISLEPKKISIYYNLSRIDKNFINKKKIDFLKDLLNNEKLELIDKAYSFFLIAQYERKNNFFKKEIFYLKKAHQNLFNSQLNLNNELLNYWLNIISKKYNTFKFINRSKDNELTSFDPVFIIGLPRSGSTIVETILSSGDTNVRNFGETNMFNGALLSTHNLLREKDDNKINLNLINKTIKDFIEYENIQKTENKIFTDKSLENFFYIEIILKIFPKAKFINTFRNLEDNVFAIFQQAFLKMSWTNSIEHILEYIDNYLKVISFFKNQYPDKILSLNLEDLTMNPKEVSKKLFKFCGLKWNEKVLKFYKREDLIVTTASNIQIRENINKYDFEKYEPYKEFLKIFSGKYDWLSQK